jgi:hypothetical protein
MVWIVLGVAWVCVHLLLYVAVLRYLKAFRREAVIFGYHCASFAALVLTLAVSGGLATWGGAAAISIHGIYSLSFLELWALSDASYSLSILWQVDQFRFRGLTAHSTDISGLEAIGASKRHGRTETLVRFGLARKRGDSLELTRPGAVTAAVVRLIAWTANVQRSG